MSQPKYPQLFKPLKIGEVEIPNRIMTSGHQTTLVKDHLPTEDFHAYHVERAKGGVGLIVMEAHGVHKTGLNTSFAIDASNPEIVALHRETAKKVHDQGGKIIAQIMHQGREAYVSENNNDVVAPSAVPTERFHIIPRELEEEEIEDIIDGFVKSAFHLKEAGLDGAEFVGSHAYLFEQFWSPITNKRTDKWGGSFEKRLRFTKEVIQRVRSAVGKDFVLGMRMSLESKDDVGTSGEESLEIIRNIQTLGLLDYWSLVIGSSATYKGSSYIVPPSSEKAADLFLNAKKVKDIISPLPLMITSRIYTAKIAEQMITEGYAEVVGMTRALIADPHLPNKISEEREDQIIPCIACNQGCIGRYQAHLPIRCTVNPVTGRELYYSNLPKAEKKRVVVVVGGGPAGMMAAITLKKQGHIVTLYEEKERLGGQLNVIEGAPNKEQIRNWKNYLIDETKRLGINVKLSKRFTVEEYEVEKLDCVIIAAGSKPLLLDRPESSKISYYTSWEIFNDSNVKEGNVIVLDWKGDWSGVEAAELLASKGKKVEIISQTYAIGEAIQQYKRNKMLERLDHLQVRQTPNFKISKAEEDGLVIQHMFSGRKERRHPEAVVLSIGQDASHSLNEYRKLKKESIQVIRIGDALSPRSLDEAVLEGYKAALEISIQEKEEIVYG